MSELSALNPPVLWQLFSQICAIPHPSHHEDALAQHILHLAQQNNIFAERDQTGNILLRKPATAGLENKQSVVLQAHLDMVPQKNNDTVHDFIRDPIHPYIDGEWVKAKGTTLGADNGIGMASALAILFDNSVQHGPIEVLLTMTEETGMVGAFGLKPCWLESRLLINTDSEAEGEVYTGCAGGLNFNISLPLKHVDAPNNQLAYRVNIKGLKGGHSGIDIHLGLGNANKILARFLFDYAQSLQLKIIDIRGGTLRNAIPREAYVDFLIDTDQQQNLIRNCNEFNQLLIAELGAVEKNIQVELVTIDAQNAIIDPTLQTQLIAWLNCLPNGVVRMSDEAQGVTETSSNLGVINIENGELNVVCLIRSLVDSAKHYAAETLAAHSQLIGANYSMTGDYPGWKPDPHSQLTKLTLDTYQQLYNKPAKNMVIHAGLECGLFKKPYPEMDMVSIGPTIIGAHSPDERVNIASVAKYWQLLTAILIAIPNK